MAMRESIPKRADGQPNTPDLPRQPYDAINPNSGRVKRFSEQTILEATKAGLVMPCRACAVRDHTVCAALGAEEQARMASILTEVEFAAHQEVFNETESADHVFNVTKGTVKIYKLLADGRQQITGFLFPGDFLGLMRKATYAYSAEAVTDVKLCRFPRRKFETLLDESPNLEKRLLGVASHELAAAQDQMLLLGRKTAREKLASFLIMLSNAAAAHGAPRNPVLLPMSRSEIADYLGLTIETVSRTFTQLRKDKLIELVDDGAVKLLRPLELETQSAGS
jgi:CRP/FNR family transcriptional regulator